MKDLLLIILLIFVGQTLGSLIGIIKKPGKIILYGSLAFAASMMISISLFQLIPEGLKIASPSLIIVSFLMGVIVMRIVDRLLPHINPELGKKEKPSVKRSTTMLVIGMALHNLPEGLAIGIGFALESKLGIVIALGIAMQDVPENIATIVPLYAVTKKKARSFFITTGTILFEFIGFILGYFIFRELPLYILGASLALAGGFMVYISLEELIPSAQINKYPKTGAIGVILGVICVGLTSLV